MSVKKILAAAVSVVVIGLSGVNAQEESNGGSGISSDLGVDIFSSYVWRGTKFGTGAAFQPWVEFEVGGLTFGSWGSVSTGGVEDKEMDLYISYSFDFGLTLGFTDYYFGGDWFDFESTHFFEPSAEIEIGDFSILGAYMFGDDTEDIYVELGYSFSQFSVALGAGNGAYTDDGDFSICNITLSKEKEIKITESFSLPIMGAVTLNPSTERFYVYVGISF